MMTKEVNIIEIARQNPKERKRKKKKKEVVLIKIL